MSGIENKEPYARNYNNCIEVLKEIDADIIGLQEIGKHPTRGLPECDINSPVISYLADKMGMYGYFAKAIDVFGNDKYPYGNGLLSKYPIKSAKTVIIPDAEQTEKGYYETRSLLVAELEISGGVTVMVSHFGLMSGEILNAVETVIKNADKAEGPVMFMGDLNSTPDSKYIAPLFERFRDTANGSMKPLTWPSNIDGDPHEWEKQFKSAIGNNYARKLDYIFVSEHFNVKGFSVMHTLASDHLPFIAELEL